MELNNIFLVIGILCFIFAVFMLGRVYEMENHFNTAPSNYINESQITLYNSSFCVQVEHPRLSRYANSGSMKPTIDENANGITIPIHNESEVHIGDIVTYTSDVGLVVHRIIDIGKDKNGTYFIFKGDNNGVSDGKIRFKQIKYKTIAIIW